MKVIVVLLALFLVACSDSTESNIRSTSQAMEEWTLTINKTVLPGMNIEAVRELLTQYDSKVAFSKQENKMVAVLETIKDSSPVCSQWAIMASVEFNTNGNAEMINVKKIGTCL